MFRRVVTAFALFSSALAVAVAIVWCMYCNAPAVYGPGYNLATGDEWQNVTRQITLGRGVIVYDLSLTQARFKFACFNVYNPKYPSRIYAYLETYCGAFVFFLILPAIWLVWLIRKRKRDERFVDRADEERVVIYPHQRRWAITSLIVGVLGFPIYVAIIFSWGWLIGPEIQALVGALALGFILLFGIPPCCAAFVYKTQSRWRGSAMGGVGAFLTIVWVAIWIDLFFFLPSYA